MTEFRNVTNEQSVPMLCSTHKDSFYWMWSWPIHHCSICLHRQKIKSLCKFCSCDLQCAQQEHYSLNHDVQYTQTESWKCTVAMISMESMLIYIFKGSIIIREQICIPSSNYVTAKHTDLPESQMWLIYQLDQPLPSCQLDGYSLCCVLEYQSW